MTVLTSPSLEKTQIQQFNEYIKSLKKPKVIEWYSVHTDMNGKIKKLITDDKKIISFVKTLGLVD
jgi:hypothetical protein